MTVALVALFVALGGTSIAAVTSVPLRSVGPAQLKNNAVTNPKIAGNAVTSNKVKNGTLVAADFKAGQLKAGPAGPAGPAGAAGPAGPSGTGATLAFGTQLSDNPTTTSSTSLQDLGSASVTVPEGSTATIIAQFSAESFCGGPGGWCSVRLFIDGTEMNPEDGTNYAFDSPAGAGDPTDWEAHSVTRLRTGIGAGAHTIAARVQIVGAATSFRLDDWVIFVQALKQA
jgi:hypothetical protein